MKFYDCASAPSPRRVRIFLAEKGMSLPTIQVDLRNNAQFAPEFRAINPDCTVPVLVLDDGTAIADAVAICLYLEAMQPDPPLLGHDAEEKAVVAEWQRRAEREGFQAVVEAFRNRTPGLKGRAMPGPDDYAQIPELAERGRARVSAFFGRMDERLALSEHVAGPDYTIADITTLVTVDFARWAKIAVPEDCTHLRAWIARVSARPSALA